jgi:hypothetical protein
MAKEPFASKLTSIWIGAFFFWMIKGFRGKYEEQLVKELESRNVWTGYFISLLFIFLVGYAVYNYR